MHTESLVTIFETVDLVTDLENLQEKDNLFDFSN